MANAQRLKLIKVAKNNLKCFFIFLEVWQLFKLLYLQEVAEQSVFLFSKILTQFLLLVVSFAAVLSLPATAAGAGIKPATLG
jgi:hypothetical protein